LSNVQSATPDEQILMKLYSFAICDIRMCVKVDNPGSNFFKEIIIITGGGFPFVS